MAIIKEMDLKLANMIAAGEVVERPSSVIKELVENALDAEAKHIEVRIYDAGRSKIVVTDDGTGMDKEDAQLAFKRHASSKLLSEYQLFKIKTMGFRGEALPSIASVSKVTLETSLKDGVGTKVQVQNGELKVSDGVSRQGTKIMVEELFYNTPVRLKFLKSDFTEIANSIEVMERLALSRSDCAFSFYIDDKEQFVTTGRGDLLEVISILFGTNIAKKMIPIEKEELHFSLRGFVGAPEISKANRYSMITLLNDRSVYIPKVQRAIIDAYRNYLFSDRFPFVVLQIQVDHSLVDVNVHPTKKEVRLSIEDELVKEVKQVIEETLLKSKPIYQAKVESKPVEKKIVSSPFITTPLFDNEDFFAPLNKEEALSSPINIFEEPEDDAVNNLKEVTSVIEPEIYETKELPYLNPIGQIDATYVVAEAEDGFYLIDQHAAEERVNYEYFSHLFNQKIEVVSPLIPILINVTSSEMLRLSKDKIKLLEQVGLELEPFGPNTLKITSIPVFLKEKNESDYFKGLLEQVLRNDKIDLESLRKDVIASVACKASIKAHKQLSIIEMKDLINRLFKCSNPTCCPHGRPTMIHFTKYEIEKMFKRAGV